MHSEPGYVYDVLKEERASKQTLDESGGLRNPRVTKVPFGGEIIVQECLFVFRNRCFDVMPWFRFSGVLINSRNPAF